MNDFKTFDGAFELFRGVGSVGNENCIFVTYKDTGRDGMKYGLMGALGGAAGGAIAGAASFMNGMADGLNKNFDGLLINQTENGLGIIPLTTDGIALTISPAKLHPNVSDFVFIPNEGIEEIKVKGLPLNKNIKKLKIKIRDFKTLHLTFNRKEKSVPYQEENTALFIEKNK